MMSTSVTAPQYMGTLKYIEVSSRSLGSVLIFGLTLGLYQAGFPVVAAVSATLPLAGLIGTCFLAESPVFISRYFSQDFHISLLSFFTNHRKNCFDAR